MDLIDGQPTGSVRISFGYMSTLEDAQAFLRFIIATRLHSSHGQPLPLAAPGEAGALPGDSEAQNAMPAARARGSSSPQEDTSPHSRVWNNSPTAVDAEGLCPPLLEATGTQQTTSEKAADVPDGDLRSHVITNLFLYPIKSCAAFEVRVSVAAKEIASFVFIFKYFLIKQRKKVQEVKGSMQKIKPSVPAAPRLSGYSSQALEHRLSSCDPWVQWLCSMWDFLGPVSPGLVAGSFFFFFFFRFLNFFF